VAQPMQPLFAVDTYRVIFSYLFGVPEIVFMSFHFAEATADVLITAAIDPIARIPVFRAEAAR
jgi:hypothetical protein